MTEALLALPAHLRTRLAKALESGLLTEPWSEIQLRSTLGLREDTADVMAALGEFGRLGVSGRVGAAWIRSLDEALKRVPRPDLVWSGPSVPGVHARDTRQVFEQLLGSAERSVWLSSYSYYDGKRAFDVLARRMEECPGLRVKILLNIERHKGNTTKAEDLVVRFAENLWRAWPGKTRPSVYYDPRSLAISDSAEQKVQKSVLHAKAAVTDNESVFVTSANLSEAAFDRNIELGLLVRDRALAISVTSHFQGLIDNKILIPLPK